MAEWSLGWNTNGTGDGVSGGYTQNGFRTMLSSWWIGDGTDEGVYKGVLNNLAVSASGGTASPVTIDTGAGIVRGFFYYSSSSGTKEIPTPAADTRIDRIVLRCDWGSQTVRFGRVAGSEGGGTPSLTKTDGTLYEIPLAVASITTGGVVTVTDERVYVHPNIEIEDGMIAEAAVGSAELKAYSVTAAELANDSVGSYALADNAISPGHINNRTRNLFVPAVYAYDQGGGIATFTVEGGWRFPNNAGTAGLVTAAGYGVTPEDYVSGFSVRSVYLTDNATGTCWLKNSVRYAATDSSAFAAASAWSGAAQIENAQKQYIGSAVTLSGIGARDTFKLAAQRYAGTATDTYAGAMDFFGWRITYTADS